MSGQKETTVRNPRAQSTADQIENDYEREMEHLRDQRDAAERARRNAEARFDELDQKVDNIYDEQNAQINQLASEQQAFMRQTQKRFQKQEENIRNNYRQIINLRAAQKQEEINRKREIAQVRHENHKQIARVRRDMAKANYEQKRALIATEKRLKTQIFDTEKRLSDEIRKTRAATAKKFVEMDRKFSTQLTNLRYETKKEIAAVKNHMQQQINMLASAQVEQKKKLAAAAKTWIDYCKIMINSIKLTDHEKFFPGVLNGRMINEYNRATNFFNQGIYESAMSAAVTLFDNLEEMYLNTREKEMQYEHELFLFEEEIGVTLSEYRANRYIHFTIDTSVGAEEVKLDTNYWSFGAYEQLKNKIMVVVNSLKRVGRMSTDEINAQKSNLAGYQAEISKITEQAKHRLVASEFRVNVAQVVDRALQNLGYKVGIDGSAFLNNDNRNEFHLKSEDGLGNAIVAVIGVDERDISSAKIALHFFDKTKDIKTFATYSEVVMNALKEENIVVGELNTIKGFETRSSDKVSLLNIAQTRKGNKQ